MKLNYFIYTFFLCYSLVSFSQIKENDVLFTVDGDQITAEEFIRVYNKNLDLVKDENQKDVDAYLKLFINYQLKLKEARRLELDKDPKYLREFASYKKQLTKSHMSESKVTEALVKEAYERMSYDIKASHILVRVDANEKDTLKYYNEIKALRDRTVNEGFETVREKVHNGNTVFGEDLGYFSGFKMVYNFENVAYNTKVDEISQPFRTQFGYHILKVYDKRPSRGQVTVAHIMVSLKQKDSLLNSEVRINEIYKKLNQGEKFEALVKQFSDDKSSINKGGKLSPFKGGQLSSAEFEDMAFSLAEKGDLSKPFKTQYGWHIVKLIDKKGLQPFKELKTSLQNKVKRDSRSKLINSALAEELKTKLKIEEHKEEALSYFKTVLNENHFKRSWAIPENLTKDKALFKINDKTYTFGNFANHLVSVQRVYASKNVDFDILINKEYNAFFEKSLIKYHEDNLEFTNPEFANIIKEYRDGLLLFDLMEKTIWNTASKDSVGLQKFYDEHKSNYMWTDRVDVVIATAAKKSDIKTVLKLLNEGKSTKDINEILNTDDEQKVIFSNGIKEVKDQSLPKNLELNEGVTKIYNYNDAYHVLDIKEILPSTIKTFEETRGKVVNDYQNKIEEDWLATLNSRFKVEINQSVLEKVKSIILN